MFGALEITPANCNKLEHNEYFISAICLRKECNEQSAVCHKCLLQSHSYCVNQILLFEDLPQLIGKIENESEVIIQIIETLIKQLKQIQKQYQQNIQFIHQYKKVPNLSNLNKLGTIIKTQRLDLDSVVIGNELISQFIETYLSPVIQQVISDQQRIESEKWQEQGELHFQSQYFLKAIECYNRALSINPKSESFWNDKGLALTQVNQLQEAIICYDQALKINPNYFDVLNNKGQALYQIHQFEEAIQCFDKSISIKPTAFIYYEKSKSLECVNKLPEAMECLKKALELNQNYEKAKQKLIEIQQRLKI